MMFDLQTPYHVFGAFFFACWIYAWAWRTFKPAFYTVLIVMVAGITLELQQAATIYGALTLNTLGDLIANAAGIILGILFVRRLR